MTQNEPPEGPPGGVEPTASPPSGGPPTDPQSEGRVPAAQPAWPDAAAAAPATAPSAAATGGEPTEGMTPSPGTPGAPGAVPPGSTPDGGWTPTGLTPTTGWSAAATARPPGRFGLLPRLIIPAIIVVVLVGGFLLRDRLTGNVGELKPGDCFDDPISAGQGSAEIQDVQHRPCSEPHLFEVIETFKFPSGGDAAFPGQTGFDSFIVEKCSAAFVGYIGISEEQSSLTFMAYTPVESGWSKGDRDVTCFLGAPDGSNLTGSMKDASR